MQLVYTPDGEDFILVATNYGQPNHPGWSYNLDAKPEAEIQHNREKFRVNVTRLSDAEKAEIWPRLCENVPPYAVYVTRTDRNIRVYRLRRAA